MNPTTVKSILTIVSYVIYCINQILGEARPVHEILIPVNVVGGVPGLDALVAPDFVQEGIVVSSALLTSVGALTISLQVSTSGRISILEASPAEHHRCHERGPLLWCGLLHCFTEVA